MKIFFDNVKVGIMGDKAEKPAVFHDWQELTWPGISDSTITGMDPDPDGDGMSNLRICNNFCGVLFSPPHYKACSPAISVAPTAFIPRSRPDFHKS